jgi:F420-non-reducing hydrogenase large subunit
MTEKTIYINPVSRLEGEAKISIFLDDKGNAEDAYFQVTEYRGFEKFCEGRAAEELPRIVSRICGVCPWPHHIASAKALDTAFRVKTPKTGEDLRRMGITEHVFYSHSAHFFALAGPDFVLGVDAEPKERNLLGLLRADKDLTVEVLKQRHHSHRIQEILGGKSIHPISAIPGGVSKRLTEENRKEIIERSKDMIKFCKFSLTWFEELLEKNKLMKLIKGDIYENEYNYLATVNKDGYIDYYGGEGVFIDTEGEEIARFNPMDYDNNITEHCEPWCTAKQTFIQKIGWKGFESGKDSGVYSVGPLARMNIAKYSTPLAQKAQKRIFEIVPKPCHHQLVANWARLVEMLNAAELMVELAKKPHITNDEYRAIPPREIGGRGVGIVEAPRGTLIHDYTIDENAMVEKVNLIVATTHNIAPINISVREAAKKVIKNGNYNDQAVLNMVEVAFRSYDPCLACSTHTPTGSLPLEVKIFDKDRKIKDVLRRK